MMKGISTIHVHLLGSSFKDSSTLAQIVIDIIMLCVLIFAWNRLPELESLGGAFWGVSAAASLLLAWYLLTIIDLFLHEGRLKTTYAYIIFYFFIACFRFTADAFILAGTHRIISVQIYHRLKRPAVWHLFGELVVIVLYISALYHVGSLLAEAGLWLQVADPSIIGVVGGRKDKFDATFTIITFLFTMFMLWGAGMSFRCYQKEEGKVPLQASLSVAATGLLWIRSFSEIVIVVRYHLRRYPAPTNTPVARDTIYGLCTVAFLILITNIVDGMTKEHARNPLLAKMEEDTRNSIIAKIEAERDKRKPAPTLAGVFEAIKRDPDSVLSNETRQAVYGGDPNQRDILRERHRDYLNCLEKKCGKYVSEDRSRET